MLMNKPLTCKLRRKTPLLQQGSQTGNHKQGITNQVSPGTMTAPPPLYCVLPTHSLPLGAKEFANL